MKKESVETIELFKEQIKDYEKLTLEQMKSLYISIQNETDKAEKIKLRERLIKGSLKHVIDHVENGRMDFLEGKTIDMGDIINGAIKSWIEIIDEGYLLKVSPISQLFYSSAFNRGLIKALGIEKKEQLSITTYIELLNYFIAEKQSNPNYTYKDFLEYLSSDPKYSFSSQLDASNAYILFCKILDNVEGYGEELILTKTKLSKLKNVLLDNYYTDELDPEIETNPFEKMEEKAKCDAILQTMIDSDLRESTKQILILRYGLKGERPHSLNELAEIFKTTKSNISERIINALRKLSLNPEFQKIANDENYGLKKE